MEMVPDDELSEEARDRIWNDETFLLWFLPILDLPATPNDWVYTTHVEQVIRRLIVGDIDIAGCPKFVWRHGLRAADIGPRDRTTAARHAIRQCILRHQASSDRRTHKH
ncbi:MAG: hypothetical protein EXR09_02075 [Acetobacteraceae bacterium]|nr:hypothetical protein [Acetobacteraceae bacterium]